MGMNSFACLEETLAFDSSFWSCNCTEMQRSIQELTKKLNEKTLELQTFQISAMEEIKRKDDQIQKLNYILSKTVQERDEALQNLKYLVNKVMLETPRATNSDSLSYSSSPMDPFFDPEISPELDSSSADANCIATNKQLVICSSSTTQSDHGAYARLQCIAKSKPLPVKGKLVDAVMKAGPLLQTLMVAGPLPKWKNPPPVVPVQVPSGQGLDCNPGMSLSNSVLGKRSWGGMSLPCVSFQWQKSQ